MSHPTWISEIARLSIVPAHAEHVLHRLNAAWPAQLPDLKGVVHSFVDQGAALSHLLAVSPISGEKLLSDPASLVWLSQPEIHDAPRGPRRMRSEYLSAVADAFDPAFRALRRAKGREMFRIALREVAGRSSMEQTTLELTHLAELCVSVVCSAWMEEFARRWGRPATEFAVLGMGKFGGAELNYSSDIDVIFFYGEDGHLNPRFTYQEFFARLAEKIVATFTAAEAEGSLFRIDLRLRPEGVSGPLVRSLDSMENYYSGFGETWERMALIKARVVAGTEGAAELGYEFAHRLQPFVFPRAVSLDVVEEIRAIKDRIEREIVGQVKLRRNVKLGYGGIREIEFVVQTLQILHAARHAFLQERGTLKTLANLRQLDIIPQAEMETLIEAYRFLRTVEHRLQIESEAQTHTLPEEPSELARLAASLAQSGSLETVAGDPAALRETLEHHPGNLVAAFTEKLHRHTDAVRAIFDRVLGVRETSSGEGEDERDLSFFAQPEHAGKVLDELREGPSMTVVAPRTRRLYARLEPLLLEELHAVADPDAALNRFVRFVERYGIRGLLFETLIRSPRVLELLVKLFDASQFMTDIALRRPQLIEEVARGGDLGRIMGVPEYLAGLSANDEGLPWEDWERAYRHAQILRTGLRDVLGIATPRQVQLENSALAEACLVFTQKVLGLTDRLTVVAMGKFGGRELIYGADLDVVFLGEDLAGAATIIRTMSARTAEGAIFSVDARLRPEGDAGQLAIPLAAYEQYFERRAQVWEAQALTKARTISGPLRQVTQEAIHRIWASFGARDDLAEQIAAMHARIVRERAGANDSLDFKAGTGGLIQVEFFTQAQQMRSGIWEQNTLDALAALAVSGAIEAGAGERLGDAYSFLRKIETTLRRMDNSSVSKLPADELGRKQLAIRCGFRTGEELFDAVSSARETVAKLAKLTEID